MSFMRKAKWLLYTISTDRWSKSSGRQIGGNGEFRITFKEREAAEWSILFFVEFTTAYILPATYCVPSAPAVLWLNNCAFKRFDTPCICVCRYNQQLKQNEEEVQQSWSATYSDEWSGEVLLCYCKSNESALCTHQSCYIDQTNMLCLCKIEICF